MCVPAAMCGLHARAVVLGVQGQRAFGVLVVALPSDAEGCELRVRHMREEEGLALGTSGGAGCVCVCVWGGSK